MGNKVMSMNLNRPTGEAVMSDKMIKAYHDIGVLLTNPNVPNSVKELHACVHAVLAQKIGS